MLYFPKTSDTRALKLLIKKSIFKYTGRTGSLRKAEVLRKGLETDECNLYDYTYSSEEIHFDNDRIYRAGNPIVLADLLVGVVFLYKYADDAVRSLLESLNLRLRPITIGTTNALFYEGESYDSKDTYIPVYEIVHKNRVDVFHLI